MKRKRNCTQKIIILQRKTLDANKDIMYCISKFLSNVALFSLSFVQKSHYKLYWPLFLQRIIHTLKNNVNPLFVECLEIDKNQKDFNLEKYPKLKQLFYDNEWELPLIPSLTKLTIGLNTNCFAPNPNLKTLMFDYYFKGSIPSVFGLENLIYLHINVPITIDLLPPNLTRLFMNCNMKPIIANGYEKFTQPLKILYLTRCCDQFISLPETLTEFSFLGLFFDFIIPEKVSVLELGTMKNARLKKDFVFPPNLLKFASLGWFSDSILCDDAYLPISLTTLKIHYHKIESKNFAHLSNLKTLHLFQFTAVNVPSLTKLRLRKSYDGINLPRSLTNLSFGNRASCLPDQLLLLTNLKKLEWGGWIKNLHDYIPESVTTLRLDLLNKQDLYGFHMPSNIKNFTMIGNGNMNPNIFQDANYLKSITLNDFNRCLRKVKFPESLRMMSFGENFQKSVFRNMFGTQLCKIRLSKNYILGEDFIVLCKNHLIFQTEYFIQ